MVRITLSKITQVCWNSIFLSFGWFSAYSQLLADLHRTGNHGKILLRKLCYVYVHVHVDGDDGMGNKWEDIKERELSSLFTQCGRQHYTVGKRIGSWFSAP